MTGSRAVLAAAALAGVVLLVVGLQAMPDREPPLPVLSTIPDFTLTSARGETVAREDLLGRPWVADLIFTSCAGICPRMTSEMSRLEEASRDVAEVKFVSISVDPERDTPEVLAEYARKAGAERDRWLFLTGERETIYELASAGFLLPAEEGDPTRGEETVLHSSRFVLVDGQGRLRGTYDARDPEALARLRGDLRRVDDAPVS